MNREIQSVVEVLRTVKDPGTGQDLIRLRMVRDLKLESRQLHFKIFLPSGSYAHKDSLYADLHEKLQARFPTFEIHAHFVNQAPYADAPNTLLPQISNFIAVASGKGGAPRSRLFHEFRPLGAQDEAPFRARRHAFGRQAGLRGGAGRHRRQAQRQDGAPAAGSSEASLEGLRHPAEGA